MTPAQRSDSTCADAVQPELIPSSCVVRTCDGRCYDCDLIGCQNADHDFYYHCVNASGVADVCGDWCCARGCKSASACVSAEIGARGHGVRCAGF